MFKNLTINWIAIYVTLCVSAINFVALYFINRKFEIQPDLLVSFGYGILFFAIVFFTVRFFLSELVFSKIKLIYKIIQGSKSTARGGNESLSDLLETDLNEVNDQVVQWARNTESEIQNLKNLEVYRRNYLGNISHELKTPIFSIQGYLHTLMDGGLNDEKINMRYIERAAANADRLQHIVDDLEVINKLEDESILDLSNFDIKDLVEEVFRDLEMLAKQKKIKLGFEKNAGSPYMVVADRERIRQVLINLITNSIKYGKDKGKTTISFHDLAEKVMVDVSDNGIGIGEKHVNHVFDRFYRVDTSRSRKLGGSGLGLSIVKHILEAHNQRIQVKSEAGKGSTFSFTLDKMK